MDFPQLPAEILERQNKERPTLQVSIGRGLPPRPKDWQPPEITLAGPKERIPDVDEYLIESIRDFAWQIEYVTKHEVADVYPSLSLWVSGHWYASSQSLVEPFGGVAIPDVTDSSHWWAKPAVTCPEEASQLDVPCTLGPQIEKYLQLVEYMRDSVEGAYPVGGFVLTGPVDTASYIFGFQSLMEAIYEHPEAVRHVCDIVTDYLFYLIPILLRAAKPDITQDEIAQAGCYLCCETRSVLSDAVLAEFETPYLPRFQEAFGSLHVHACGNWVQHMSRLAREKYCTSIDFGHPECDFTDSAKLIGDAVTISPTTNVSNADYEMPPEEWYAEIFRGIRDDSRISLGVPYEHTEAFNAAYIKVEKEGKLALPLQNVGLLELLPEM